MLTHRSDHIAQTILTIMRLLLLGCLAFLQFIMQMLVYNLLFTLLYCTLVTLRCLKFIPGIAWLALHGFKALRSWIVENTQFGILDGSRYPHNSYLPYHASPLEDHAATQLVFLFRGKNVGVPLQLETYTEGQQTVRTHRMPNINKKFLTDNTFLARVDAYAEYILTEIHASPNLSKVQLYGHSMGAAFVSFVLERILEDERVQQRSQLEIRVVLDRTYTTLSSAAVGRSQYSVFKFLISSCLQLIGFDVSVVDAIKRSAALCDSSGPNVALNIITAQHDEVLYDESLSQIHVQTYSSEHFKIRGFTALATHGDNTYIEPLAELTGWSGPNIPHEKLAHCYARLLCVDNDIYHTQQMPRSLAKAYHYKRCILAFIVLKNIGAFSLLAPIAHLTCHIAHLNHLPALLTSLSIGYLCAAAFIHFCASFLDIKLNDERESSLIKAFGTLPEWSIIQAHKRFSIRKNLCFLHAYSGHFMTAFLTCSVLIIVYFEVFAFPLPFELSLSPGFLALSLTLINVLIAHGYAYQLSTKVLHVASN